MIIDAQELKQKISESDVITILKLLGAKTFIDTKEAIITQTVCHKGHSDKLYYYKNSNMFHCYTDCGDNFDIIELVKRNKNYININFAIQWITTQLGIDTYTYGFKEQNKIEIIKDWDFISGYINRKQRKANVKQELPELNINILNIFQKMYWEEWLKDGISIESMKKYNILYNTLYQKVIIPHFDMNNRLIGIRGRATDEDEVDIFGKYTPFMWQGQMFNHPLSQNLYGLNQNKNTIQLKKKIMLVESEKGVLQTDTMFGEDNFTVAICGNNLSDFQRDLILSLGVEEVIIGLDRQYKEIDDVEYNKWSKHIRERLVAKLAPFVRVYVLWDTEGLLKYKDSPTDVSKEVLLKLMKNKIYVETYNESEVIL
jgi:hypothetical protein